MGVGVGQAVSKVWAQGCCSPHLRLYSVDEDLGCQVPPPCFLPSLPNNANPQQLHDTASTWPAARLAP